MAYSLGDPYASLRHVLRVNSFLLGLLPGALLLPAAPRILQAIGVGGTADGGGAGALLGWSLAGAALVGAGALLLATAGRPELDRASLLACSAFHILLALVLLTGYLRGGLVASNLAAVVLLVGAFLLCLLGAIAPLQYFGPQYRD